MITTKLPQELFDTLCLRLDKNGKALNDNDFSAFRRKLESSARTTFDGVEVSTVYLNFAVEMLAHNVTVNGDKYASTIDKFVLFEIDQILNAPEAPTYSIANIETQKVQPKRNSKKLDFRDINVGFQFDANSN